MLYLSENTYMSLVFVLVFVLSRLKIDVFATHLTLFL